MRNSGLKLKKTIFSFILLCCFNSFAEEPSRRPYRMGFTPWPYDATQNAVDDVYSKIHQYGDIISHHIGGGVPWQEALDGTEYSEQLNHEISGRLAHTELPVFLSIEVLNAQRNGLALYWGEDVNQPLQGDWINRSFNDQEVIDAYVRFALDMIEKFDPLYFNYGVEASDLIFSNPQGFNDFIVFASQVYPRIKAAYPEVKLMVSVALKTPSSLEGILMQKEMPSLVEYVDVLGISVYGYLFFDHEDKGNPANLPGNWLSQVLGFSNGKPLAIAENGWIAETLTVETFGLSVTSTPSFQASYVDKLLAEVDRLNMEFVIWFNMVDFDALWSGVLGEDPLAALWRDTGLFDHHLAMRPALSPWSRALARPRHQFIVPHIATTWTNFLLVDYSGSIPASFTIEPFDEQGNSLGEFEISAPFFSKINLSEQFPAAHSSTISCESDALSFRLVYIEPEEKGLAEFSLSEELYSELLFTFPLFDPLEATLTWKGLALVSSGSQVLTVALKAFDQLGTPLAETSITIQANQRIRGTLESIFQGMTHEQAMQVVRVTAVSDSKQLSGLNISGNGNLQLLFTQAKER